MRNFEVINLKDLLRTFIVKIGVETFGKYIANNSDDIYRIPHLIFQELCKFE